MINVDVTLNQWATVIQISILLVLVFVFYALWKNFPRRVVLAWMLAWISNLLAITFIYFVLLGSDKFPDIVLKSFYLTYAIFKTWFAILLAVGFWRYFMHKALFAKRTLINGFLVSLGVALVIDFSPLNSLHIQILIYTLVGLIFTVTSLCLLLKNSLKTAWVLKMVFFLEGIVFLHHAWVLYPVIWGGEIPSYMTHISFFDSISELIVGIACLFAITNRVIHEISLSNLELENVQQELRQLVDIDPLTGLLNRGKLEPYVNENNKDVTLVYIDVNNFKSINDSLGHSIGDKCLQKISSTLKQLLNKQAGIFRLGGDEFLAVIPNNSRINIDDFKQDLNTILAQATDNLPALTVAIGIHTMSKNSEFSHALKQADTAMYQSKKTS